MADTSLTPAAARDISERPPDDAPSKHSSMDIIMPERESTPAATETVASQPGAADTTFRDAQEYQGRAQDLEEDGRQALPPAEAYDNVAEGAPA